MELTLQDKVFIKRQLQKGEYVEKIVWSFIEENEDVSKRIIKDAVMEAISEIENE